MWPSAAVGDIFLASVLGLIEGQRTINTFAYRVTTLGGDFPTVETVYDDLSDALIDIGHIVSTMVEAAPDNWSATAIRVQRIAPTRVMYKEYGIGTPGLRATSGATNVAAVISRRGVLANRKNVSTLHVVLGTGTDDMSDGLVGGAVKDLLEDLSDLIVLPLALGGGGGYAVAPVIYNPGSTPDYSTIIAAAPQETVRVMRRRTVGVGI